MPRLRNPSLRTTRQSINRNHNPATTPFMEASTSSRAWAPPETVAQNLSRLSDSPLVSARNPSPTGEPETSSQFKSFIGDFLSGGKKISEPVEPSPRLTAAKFQFKTASITTDLPDSHRTSPPEKRPPLDDSVGVNEHELMVEDEDETLQLPSPERPDGATRTNTSDNTDYDLSKSPFCIQSNPIPSPPPRAPKVARGSPSTAAPAATITVHVIDSDELPTRDDMKEFRFDEIQQPTFLKKSFTQDIVTGFLNTQSDFFQSQMGKTVDEECLFPPKEPTMTKKFSSIGTMTDPVADQIEVRQPLADKMLQQRESVRAVVSNLNRANAAIVKIVTQIEKVCGNSKIH